jgi:hypothetical protein
MQHAMPNDLRGWEDLISALSTGIVALFTIALFRVGWRQIRDTKILQRAYLSVEPEGIVTSTSGLLLGHVARTSASFPPQSSSILLRTSWSTTTPTLTDNAFRDDTDPGLVPIGAEVLQGSGGITLGEIERAELPDDEKYLYVWGRAKFKDGFDRDRWVNFCHRYPWAKREVAGGWQRNNFQTVGPLSRPR